MKFGKYKCTKGGHTEFTGVPLINQIKQDKTKLQDVHLTCKKIIYINEGKLG